MSEQIKQEGEFKIKKTTPKKFKQDEPVKIDLSKIKEEKDAVQTQETNVGDAPVEKQQDSKDSQAVVEDVRSTEEEVKPVIEEIIEEPVEDKKVEEEEEVVEIGEKMEKKITPPTPEEVREVASLPENIEKVVDFMKETGGTLEDYVRLNADYANVDNDTLLREYYKQTKSHLNSEEIDFLIDDNFSFDEEIDEERVVKKTKLAYKEEVAKARKHLDGLKSKYYEEIKLRPGVTQDQQKAMDFFNRYNEEQDIASQQHEDFRSETKDYFANEFKGFDFKIGDKKFRYGVKNPNEVAEKQSNITNTIKKFLSTDGSIKDVSGYHKAIYAAENADTIAQHFYDQGKADAIKGVVAKTKNISNETRATAPSDVFVGGYKVKAVTGLDSSKLKIKTKNFN
jgi:hypothetical protein